MTVPDTTITESEDAGSETLVELFDSINQGKKEEDQKAGLFPTLIRNPLMCAGMVVTGYFMAKGMKAASKGESLNLSQALQKRVVGQFGTLAVIIATFLYVAVEAPEKRAKAIRDEHDMQTRAMRNYKLAQAKNQ